MSESCCHAPVPAVPSPKVASKFELYAPLLVITGVAVLAAFALHSGFAVPLMTGMMGMFLCFLATLQLFSLKGFAATFKKYDPVAKHSRLYAHAFPFFELGLGLLFLADALPLLANLLVLILFAINTVGVVRVIRSGEDVRCSCIGTAFNLPVGRVTLAENLAMILMAACGLVF